MSEDPSVTFLWEIENFFYCPQEKGQILSSPVYYVDALRHSEWYLGIYPNAEDLKVFLYNIYYNGRQFFIDYNISFLHKDGSVLWTDEEQQVQVDTDTSYEIAKYPTREELYGNQGKEFNFKDKLTIRCQIWKCRMFRTYPLTYVSRTVIGIENRIFHWSVEKFNPLELHVGQGTCRIKRTHTVKTGLVKPTFLVELFLTGVNNNHAFLRIHIHQLNESISRLFSTGTVSVLNTTGHTLTSSNLDYHMFEPNGNSWKICWLLPKNGVMKKQNDYFDFHWFHLRFDLTFNSGEEHSIIESVTSMPSWAQTPKANHASEPLNDERDPDCDENSGEPFTVQQEDLLSLYKDAGYTFSVSSLERL